MVETCLHDGTVLFFGVVGTKVAEDDLTRRVVLEHLLGCLRHVRVRAARDPALLECIHGQHSGHVVVRTVSRRQLHLVEALKDMLGHSLHDQLNGRAVLDDGLDGQDATAVHLSLRVCEAGEHETGTVDEAQGSLVALQHQRLEVLGLARHGGNADTLSAAQHVDK